MAKKNWISEILGGRILLRDEVSNNLGFFAFLFVLAIFYIYINFGIERSLLTERRNQRELKHLKSDYISKLAKLQYSSKRTEIEKKLKKLGSTLKPPVDPPTRVTIDN